MAKGNNTLGPPPRLSGDAAAAFVEVHNYLQELYNTLVLSGQFLPRAATTDFSRTVLESQSALQARATLAAMPNPEATAYQVFGGNAAGVAATLPVGGRWLWFLVQANAPARTIATISTGIDDGGTVVAAANIALMYFGVCWRIA